MTTTSRHPSELDAAIGDSEAAIDALHRLVAQRQRHFQTGPRRVLVSNPGRAPFPFPIAEEPDR
jgi:hypothetical protein